MGNTTIEWTATYDLETKKWTPGKVWNPVTGCNKVSQGCKNCYAERIAHRFWGDRKFTDVRFHPERLEEPDHWKKPSRVFVNSMSDLFHEVIPDVAIAQVFDEMISHPRHTFMVLTKRPQRALAFAKWYGTWDTTDRNIWMGVSVENQAAADERIPLLLQMPAAVRFVSCEPLLGPVDLDWINYKHLTMIDSLTGRNGFPFPHAEGGDRIDWVIVGGESGQRARPMHPKWALAIRNQCSMAGTPLFFKQWGEWILAENTDGWKTTGDPEFPALHPRLGTCWVEGDPFIKVGKKAAGRLLGGREWSDFPKVRVRG